MKKHNVLYSISCVVALLLVGMLSLGFSNQCSAASTSLTIDGGSSKTISETLAPNETKYVSSSVSYSATDVENYTLKLTYANDSNGLKLDSTGTDVTVADVVYNTSGSDISNAWGYSWTPSSTVESDYPTLQYRPIPAYGSNADSSNVETGTTISPTTKKMIFAANLSDSNPTGHYKTNLLLSLVATPKAATVYTITYNANGGSNPPSDTTCTVQGPAGTSCTTNLSPSKPTRANYTFLGWADSADAAAKQYDVGGSITVSGSKTVYAVWQISNGVWIYNNGTTKNSGITTMQQMTSSICSQVSAPASSASDSVVPKIYLEDSRDGNIYTVRKFADGRCWMANDLRLMGGSSLKETLSSSNSDGTPKSGWTMPASDLLKFDTTSTTTAAYLSSSTGYYTWCTATAGTCSDASSICPKNWKLPSGGSSGEFKTFADAVGAGNSSAGSTKLRTAPYNFTYTGRIYDGMLGSLDRGGWWSRTTYNGDNVYNLLIRESSVLLGTDNSPRYYGRAIRCVAATSTSGNPSPDDN